MVLRRITCLDLGMLLGMKTFVAHRYAQAYASQLWRGGGVGKKCLVPERFRFSELLFDLFTPCWVVHKLQAQQKSKDVHPHHHNIFLGAVAQAVRLRAIERRRAGVPRHEPMEVPHFQEPEKQKQHPITWLSLYSTPAIKLQLRAFSSLQVPAWTSAVLLTNDAVFDWREYGGEVPTISWIEVVMFIQTVANCIDNVNRMARRKILGFKFQVDAAILGNIVSLSLSLIALVLRIVSTSHQDNVHYYRVYFLFVSLTMFTSTWQSLPLLVVYTRKLGVLLIAIEEMVKAIVAFVYFISILIVVVGLCIYGVYKGGFLTVQYQEEVAGLTSPFAQQQPYMLPLYGFITPALGKMAAFDGAASLIMLTYVFFSGKVLTSMIMALFASAHQRVFKNAEIECVYKEYVQLFELVHVHSVLPIPFNLPEHVAKFLWTAAVPEVFADQVEPALLDDDDDDRAGSRMQLPRGGLNGMLLPFVDEAAGGDGDGDGDGDGGNGGDGGDAGDDGGGD